jgi:hypothetical protein
MAELNVPPCPTHGSLPKPLHTENFRGAVDAIIQIIETVSGVGTTSYSKCPYGYDANFNGLVRALEDLNTSISGIQGGADVQAGSGIYLTTSGDTVVINSETLPYQAGSGIFFTTSGTTTVINATISSVSGALYTAGSGLYLVNGTEFNVNYDQVFQNSVSGHIFGEGDNTVYYSGNTVTISGSGLASTGGGASVTVSGLPASGYQGGDLWFDTNQGRLFVYASGNGVTEPAWYQTNAEAVVVKGELPPSGTGLNAPPRDGSLWFNTLLGSLFVYDISSSGWYETGPTRSVAYGVTAPAPSEPGAGWYDSQNQHLFVWDGTSWNQV